MCVFFAGKSSVAVQTDVQPGSPVVHRGRGGEPVPHCGLFESSIAHLDTSRSSLMILFDFVECSCFILIYWCEYVHTLGTMFCFTTCTRCTCANLGSYDCISEYRLLKNVNNAFVVHVRNKSEFDMFVL